ncbi:hypothetical protein TeGR_g2275, partial [Tetraparma gracilis]
PPQGLFRRGSCRLNRIVDTESDVASDVAAASLSDLSLSYCFCLLGPAGEEKNMRVMTSSIKNEISKALESFCEDSSESDAVLKETTLGQRKTQLLKLLLQPLPDVVGAVPGLWFRQLLGHLSFASEDVNKIHELEANGLRI